MIYFIQHFISDCAIRKTNNDALVIDNLEYIFSTKFGKFSVPFYTVICEQTGFIISINGNHTHTNRIAEAILKDIEKNNQ